MDRKSIYLYRIADNLGYYEAEFTSEPPNGFVLMTDELERLSATTNLHDSKELAYYALVLGGISRAITRALPLFA